jgi:hypothetical protein
MVLGRLRDAFGVRPQAFPRDFHRPPRFAGDLITIFLKTMVLLIIKLKIDKGLNDFEKRMIITKLLGGEAN